MPVRVGITADENPAAQIRAKALADKLKLPLIPPGQAPGDTCELLLVVRERRLELFDMSCGELGPIVVDFLSGDSAQRSRSARSRRQPIAAAIGIARGVRTVVDATAGLGRDAFLLACLGCRVTAIERSAVLAVLLRDGLDRAAAGPSAIRDAVARITLTEGDARTALPLLARERPPDAVYLDPMYPPRKKTALPKKELRICRQLVGDDPDAEELFDVACRVAGRRVVVKRPGHAPPLRADPDLQHGGKMARYDVYFPKT